MMGTTTVTSYVESGAGVKAGGKTGMTSLVIGILFLGLLDWLILMVLQVHHLQ
jgi:AGZA family xanthine/uracil permease-like MFS transporter